MSAYTDDDVKAALAASESAKWETMRAIVNGTPEAEIRENVQRAVLDAVAPAIAARALREFGASFVTFDSDYDNAFVAAVAEERADDIANGRI